MIAPRKLPWRKITHTVWGWGGFQGLLLLLIMYYLPPTPPPMHLNDILVLTLKKRTFSLQVGEAEWRSSYYCLYLLEDFIVKLL